MEKLFSVEIISIPRYLTEHIINCAACKKRFILWAILKKETELSKAIGEDPVYDRMAQVSAYYCPYCGQKEDQG